jgi:hypothetical protein
MRRTSASLLHGEQFVTAMIGALAVPADFVLIYTTGTFLNATWLRPVCVTPRVAKHRRVVTA